MGFDNECIINIQSLAGEYFCPVCRLLVYPNEALQTQCTHLYCKPCLTYVVKTTQACPYDGYLVTEADSKPLVESNKALADTIGKISVHCLFHRSGCTWQGSLSECVSHCSGCAFGNSPVVCNRCGVQIVHRQVQEHAQSCSGVQTQSQQADAIQSSAPTGVGATLKQNPAVSPAAPSASQSQASVVSNAPLAPASQGFSQQQSALASQAQPAQSVLPTSDQWHQQQQQYQQYYQQYPGYDPYQQQYQQYYPYQQQSAQQYPQQPGQVYTSQVPPQPQQLPQAPALAHAQQLPYAPPAVNTQQQAHSTGQPTQLQGPSQVVSQSQQHPPPQSYVQAQNQVAPQSQQHPPPQAYSQAQNYTQPIVAHSGPQQQSRMSQYQQGHHQTQPSHPQTQAQPYIQPHVQSYTQTQTQPQAQLHPPHPSIQPHNPPILNQTGKTNTRVPAHYPSAHVVAGYQQYPQQPSQHPQPGGSHSMPGSYLPQHPGHVQGQFPQPPAQVRPPQSHAVIPSQQQSTALPIQAQHLGAPGTQASIYPQSQQPGYPAQQPLGVTPVQTSTGQQPSFPGHGSYMQQHASMQASLRPQGPGHMHQNYAVKPGLPPSMSQHSYSQAKAVANASHVQPAHLGSNQPSVSVSQTYPLQANVQSSPAVRGQQSLKISGSENPGDQNMDKVKLEQDIGVIHSVELERQKSENELDGLGYKKSLSDSSSKDHSLQKQKCSVDSELPISENVAAPEGLTETKNKVEEGSVEHSSAGTFAEIVPLDKGSGVQFLSVSTQVASEVSGNKFLPVPYGPSNQQRHVRPSMPQPVPHSNAPQNSAILGQPSSQFRPPVSGHIPPAPPFGMADGAQASILKQPPGPFHPDNPSGALLGPGSVASFGKGPGNLALPPGSFDHGNVRHHPRNLQSELSRGTAFDSHGGTTGRAHPHGSQGSFESRQPDLHFSGPMEPGSFGQPSNMRVPVPLGRDPLPTQGMWAERPKMLQDEHLRPFAGGAQHAGERQAFEDLKKFPRPPHIDSGPIGNARSLFPPPRVIDQGSFVDGNPRPFEKAPPGPIPGFGQRLMARAPGREYGGDPSRVFEGFPGGDRDVIESRSFGEGSKLFSSFSDSGRKSTNESRFTAAPSHLRRVEFDGPGNLHARFGDVLGPDMMPEHFRPNNMRPGEVPEFGCFGGQSQMGDPLHSGSFLPHRSFGETFGSDRAGYSHIGEPGFGLQRYVQDGGFQPGGVDRFNIQRFRKHGSIMCRICKVDCETVEGLDLHSQTREHQKRAMDMVISIKRQNSKKQKIANDRSPLEEGNKPRHFEGRRNKR